MENAIINTETEKIVVAIIVYNRFENLERWIHCWEKCDHLNAELVIVHNYDLGTDYSYYQSYCAEKNIKYIPRINKGYDIGAFQDICRDRLTGFDNNWNIILWITDDTLPVQKDFLSIFINKLKQPNVGVSCMHISTEFTPHIRTTGICLRKDIANKLIFPSDPINTKDQCYEFEHRSRHATLLKQIERMGLKAEMVSDIHISPLWDSGHNRIDRKTEHYNIFA